MERESLYLRRKPDVSLALVKPLCASGTNFPITSPRCAKMSLRNQSWVVECWRMFSPNLCPHPPPFWAVDAEMSSWLLCRVSLSLLLNCILFWVNVCKNQHSQHSLSLFLCLSFSWEWASIWEARSPPLFFLTSWEGCGSCILCFDLDGPLWGVVCQLRSRSSCADLLCSKGPLESGRSLCSVTRDARDILPAVWSWAQGPPYIWKGEARRHAPRPSSWRGCPAPAVACPAPGERGLPQSGWCTL